MLEKLFRFKRKKNYYYDSSVRSNLNFRYFRDAPENINELNINEHRVSVERALKIVDKDENLKKDLKNRCWIEDKEYIGFMEFTDKEVKYIEINGRGFWQITITDGRISGRRGTKGKIHWDGSLKSYKSKLRALVDVQTGEYLYYPKKKGGKLNGKSRRNME